MKREIFTEADHQGQRDNLSKRSHFAFLDMGMPVHEGQTATALINGAQIAFRAWGSDSIPSFENWDFGKGVFCPPVGSSMWLWQLKCRL